MSSHFIVTPDGTLRGMDLEFQCAIGKGGFVGADVKREGDGSSPIGLWPMRSVYYRPDKMAAPETALPVVPLRPYDGWCDAPLDPLYNRAVTLPYPASHERLWRQDDVYDIIVVLGHNDDPVIPQAGSAIFLHVAKPDYQATEGCAALEIEDLRTLLRLATPDSVLEFQI